MPGRVDKQETEGPDGRAKPRNPFPTVDIIIEHSGGIVLIERKNPPHGWALPGGFVDYGESVEHAAEREAMEETCLLLTDLRQFHVYSEPDRDPRMHTMTTVFTAVGEGDARAADDAAALCIFKADELPDAMCFDHRRILEDYLTDRWGVGRGAACDG